MAIYRAVKAINRQVALFVQSGGITIMHPEPCVCRLRQMLYRFSYFSIRTRLFTSDLSLNTRQLYINVHIALINTHQL